MNIRNIALAALPLALGLVFGATRADAATEALDAVAAASVVVSTPTVTTTTAKLSFTETETNGSLRFYYSTTSFTAADTTKATITKLSVTSRGTGSVSLTGLTAGTTYYYRFQGYYSGKNVTNYTASGSFTTTALTGIHGRPLTSGTAAAATTNVLGRPVGRSSGVSVSTAGSVPDLRGASH